MSNILVINLKSKYFNEIKNGTKKEEYRLYKDHWITRLEKKPKDFYDIVQIRLAYFSKNSEKYEEINFKYDGYKIKTIQHDEFGPEPVKVFAISLKGERLN